LVKKLELTDIKNKSATIDFEQHSRTAGKQQKRQETKPKQQNRVQNGKKKKIDIKLIHFCLVNSFELHAVKGRQR